MEQTEGKIFLAAERGHTETGRFRSYHTFHFGAYKQAHKEPFGSFYILNDDTLAGGKSAQLLVEAPSVLCLLPVVGVIEYKDSEGKEALLQAGEVQLFYLPGNASFTISNPYENDLVNYLQLLFRCGNDISIPTNSHSFSLDQYQNKLVEISILSQQDFFIKLSIGKFDGRAETAYQLTSPENRLFAFIVQGAFEVANRLLEDRDGLALWNTEQIELEALSNQAMILIIEL